MKKRLFGLLALTAGMLLVTACTNAATPSDSGKQEPSGDHQGGGTDTEPEDEDPGDDESDELDLTIQFFIDFNHTDQDNPFLEVEWYSGKLIEEPKEKPECPDPAFPTFLGWSAHSLIDDEKDLWNFKKDKTEYGTYYLALYGIWVAK